MKAGISRSELLFLSILVILISPAQAYSSCQYASFAEATSEAFGHEAKYALANPDSDQKCGTIPKAYVSWEKESWNTTAQIMLTFDKEVYPEKLMIYGDYDLCLTKVWFLRGDSWYLVNKGVVGRDTDSNCAIEYDFGLIDFKTNKIKLQPCSWTWSAIDAVRFCGSENSFPKITIVSPIQDSIVDESREKIQIKISTDIAAQCEFSFSKEFDFGEGFSMATDDGLIHAYNLSKPAQMSSILAYYKCKGENGKVNPYSVMHRLSFRYEEMPFLQLCNWQNCSEGAASISDDDGYHTTLGKADAVCSEELEKRGLKGTYFLTYTENYNESDWEIFRDAYGYGHEIGGHSRYHLCKYGINETFFREDTEKNRADILDGVGMKNEELITYAWPCGITNLDYKLWLSDYYLFARGYHKNLMGSKNPADRMEYKSINSVGYGQDPQDYYLIADTTENHQDWINYVYHDSCDNPEIFDYLMEKDIWIETIGTVSKYIAQRNSLIIENLIQEEGRMEFDIVSNLDSKIFDRELSFLLYPGNKTLEKILVNGNPAEVKNIVKGGRTYILFNVLSGKNSHVEVIGFAPIVPRCGDGRVNLGMEKCDDGNNLNGDGCSRNCQLEDNARLYVISYVGNIDGGASKDWHYFFDNLTAYYEGNKIPVAFSFFPDGIKSNSYQFSEIFKRMYLAENIELMQKGYRMDDYEKHLDTLAPEVQRHIIEEGRHVYLNRMKDILGRDVDEIDFPVTYVAPYGRMTSTTRKVLEEMGFRVSFGVYYVYELGPVESTANMDIYQYAVSFTRDGSAGRNTTFKNPDEIIEEVLSYNRVDLPITKINGRNVIPLYVHQPDFEHATNNSQLDEKKWAIYKETIERLNEHPNVTFITPYEAWKLRHPVCIPTGFSEKVCNGVDDDCDELIDEDCDFDAYANNFSFSEYNLSSIEGREDIEYYRDYFKKDSLMDKVSQFSYTIYDWAVFSANDWKARIFGFLSFLL